MGGASCGAQLAGMPVALAVDVCSHALHTHRMNHPDCRHVQAQLPDDSLPLPEGDIHIHASPPCQSFSVASHSSTEALRTRGSDFIRWAVRFCIANATTWTLEQVGTPEVLKTLDEEGVDYVLINARCFGVAQSRRRVVAGSPSIIRYLKARPESPEVVPHDVISNCRGSHIRNCTTNTLVQTNGKRRRIVLTPDHPSFARPVTRPSYTVTGRSPLRWWTPGDEKCKSFTPGELGLLQGFPSTHKLDSNSRRAVLQVGNAVPPPVMHDIIQFVLKTMCDGVCENGGCD